MLQMNAKTRVLNKKIVLLSFAAETVKPELVARAIIFSNVLPVRESRMGLSIRSDRRPKREQQRAIQHYVGKRLPGRFCI